MKQKINKELPYPLLSPYSDDYINSTFKQNIKSSINGTFLFLDLKCELDNEEMLNLVQNGQASIVYHIECSQTGFRTIVYPKAGKLDQQIQIPFSKLHGDVDINTFIIAKQKLESYQNSCFNPDYEGILFNIDEGCRIAEAEIYTVNIPLKFTDFVEENNPYVIVIPKPDSDHTPTPTINIETEKIQVLVPKKASQDYAVLQGTAGMRAILYSMFLVPAVYQGLLALKDTKGHEVDLETMKDRLWVQSMEDELRQKFGKTIADIQDANNSQLFEIADNMLGNPLLNGTEYLMKTGDITEDSDEN